MISFDGMFKVEREADGRWLADVDALPGVMSYGVTPAEARVKAGDLAIRVLADRRDRKEIGTGEALGLLLWALVGKCEEDWRCPTFSAPPSRETPWPSAIKAGKIISILTQRGDRIVDKRVGYSVLMKRSEVGFGHSSSAERLSDYVFPWAEGDELGPLAAGRIAARIGLTPEDLRPGRFAEAIRRVVGGA